jgi:single-strand DNA-binding protein
MNKVMLLGRLGKDPEKLTVSNGDALTKFILATNKTYKNKDGVKQEKTNWTHIVCWRKTAEIAAKYLSKGSQVFLEGELVNRTYEHEGVKKNASEVVAHNLELLGKGEKPQTTVNGNLKEEPVVKYACDGDQNDIPF